MQVPHRLTCKRNFNLSYKSKKMRKFDKLTLLLGASVCFAASCKAPQPLAGKFKQEQQKGKEEGATVFVVKNDGEKNCRKKTRIFQSVCLQV